MILNSKLYEAIKFIGYVVPELVAVIGGIFMACGVSDRVSTIVLTIIGGIGTMALVVQKYCKANYYKIQVGHLVETIDEYDHDYDYDDEDDGTEDGTTDGTETGTGE